MNVTDWRTDPTTGEVIKEVFIVIEDTGIKQWLEIAEVQSFRVTGTMEPYFPFEFEETNRGVHGYFAFGTNEVGYSAKPAWIDGQFINWQRSHIIAPGEYKSFRLWLRRGIEAKVFVYTEDRRGPLGAILDAAGNKLYEMVPKP